MDKNGLLCWSANQIFCPQLLFEIWPWKFEFTCKGFESFIPFSVLVEIFPWRFESFTCKGFESFIFFQFWLRFYLGDSNPLHMSQFCLHFAHMDLNPFHWNSNSNTRSWFLSVLSERFSLGVRFIFETLSNLIRNNTTSVLISSKSNKGSAFIFIFLQRFWSGISKPEVLSLPLFQFYRKKSFIFFLYFFLYSLRQNCCL